MKSCNIELFWRPRKLNDVQFSMHVSCSGMSLWRHTTPTFKAMALRSSTHTSIQIWQNTSNALC